MLLKTITHENDNNSKDSFANRLPFEWHRVAMKTSVVTERRLPVTSNFIEYFRPDVNTLTLAPGYVIKKRFHFFLRLSVCRDIDHRRC